MKKFEFTGEIKVVFGVTLRKIRATVAFGSTAAGEIGGWIETEANLSGNAWVYGDAQVYGNAQVSGNAWVYGDAQVYGNAQVSGDARVYGNAQVSGDARVSGNARVYGNARVSASKDYLIVGPIGSRSSVFTLFRCKVGALLAVGCFSGTIEEFEATVKTTHGNSDIGKEYQAVLPLLRLRAASWTIKKGE